MLFAYKTKAKLIHATFTAIIIPEQRAFEQHVVTNVLLQLLGLPEDVCEFLSEQLFSEKSFRDLGSAQKCQ